MLRIRAQLELQSNPLRGIREVNLNGNQMTIQMPTPSKWRRLLVIRLHPRYSLNQSLRTEHIRRFRDKHKT